MFKDILSCLVDFTLLPLYIPIVVIQGDIFPFSFYYGGYC